MKAIVWTAYGPPEGLSIREVPKPVPAPDEVLVRIRATAVAAGDCELRALRFSLGLRVLVRLLMGVTRPRRDKVLGQEFAGDIEAVGPEVPRLRAGDRVFGTTGFRFGAYAEYACLRAGAADGAVALKPANLSYEEAATVPTGGLEALHFLRKAGALAGRTVLIVGAGGGIGSWAVQLASVFGAEVTGVDGPRKQELMLRLGAKRVIDYTEGGTLADAGPYDVVGRGRFSEGLRATRRGGTYLAANPGVRTTLRAAWASATSGRRVVVRGGRPRVEELDALRGYLESGRIRCVVDRRYRLEQMAEAHAFVDAGLAVGRVVVSI